jgi:phage terminase large subunit
LSQHENPFLAYEEKYGGDTPLWVRDSFFPFDENGVRPDSPDEWQDQLMRWYDERERLISVRSGHGVGKTTGLAWVIIHHLIFRVPNKTIVTAATGDQLFDALAAEVKTWITKLPADVQALIDVKAESIHLKSAPTEAFVSFRTSGSDKTEALAGVHSENVLLIVDEASGVHEKVFESASGSMSGENATTILAGNPVRTSGMFHASHTKLRSQWKTLHVNSETSKRVSKAFVEDMRIRYPGGDLNNVYRVRVLGEFPLAEDNTVIPFELAEGALKRDVAVSTTREMWGIDPARYGRDETAFARRRGNRLTRPVEARQGRDTMEVTGWIKSEWDETPVAARPEIIFVDVIGIGAGIVDRLRELDLPVRGINVSESPAMREKYRYLRDELWFRGKAWLEARDVNLANDEKLLEQLIAPRYKILSNGKFQVESKDELKKRGHDSPDRADAFLLTFAEEATIGMGHRKSSKRQKKRKIKGIV